MKTQISKQHTNVVAVQPQTTFRKEDRMKKQSFTTLKLAIVFAMVTTMSLSAMAQSSNPLQVALNRWYVANEVVHFSTFYDSTGNAHALSTPSGMAFDGSNLWIGNEGNNTVMKVRASDGQFLATYTVDNPGSLAFDGQRIWVNHRTSSGGNTVSVLFASDGVPALNDITVGNMPDQMVWDGWGLWVVARDGTFKRIDNWGGTYCSGTTPGAGWDYGVAFDGNNTWISDYTNSKVYEYNYQCHLSQTVSVPGGPLAMAFDGTNMWTANQTSGTVARITPNGSVSQYTVGGSPFDVAFDGANIWVTTNSGGTVKKVTAFGSGLGTVSGAITPCVGTSGPSPLDLAFDGASMWVSCPSSNAVGKM
jgi:hypothetical protein